MSLRGGQEEARQHYVVDASHVEDNLSGRIRHVGIFEEFQYRETPKNFFTPKYPWGDESTRAFAYQVLEEIFPTFVRDLDDSVSECLGIQTSPDGGNLLFGAWAMVFCSVASDRLHLLEATNTLRLPSTFSVPGYSCVPETTRDFFFPAAYSDSYNVGLLQDIQDLFSGRAVNFQPEGSSFSELKAGGLNRGLLRRSLVTLSIKNLNFILKILSGTSRNRLPKIGLFESGFGLQQVLRLSAALRGQARVAIVEMDHTDKPAPSRELRDLLASELSEVTKREQDDLVKTIYSLAAKYLPISLLESRGKPDDESFEKEFDLIVTSSGHWLSDDFKLWMTSQRAAGAKLICCEHGGALHAEQHVFDFERQTGDWYVPGSQIGTAKGSGAEQLPIPKFCDKRPKPSPSVRRRRLTLILYEGSRWATRGSSQPQSYRALRGLEQLDYLIGSLPKNILDSTDLKAPPSKTNWPIFQEDLRAKQDRVRRLTRKPLRKIFSKSKLIVCNYPETAYGESIISGVPTILLLDQENYRIHPNSKELFAQLMIAKMAFVDPLEASQHIEHIWDDPESWWRSSTVVSTRKNFLNFLNLSDAGALGSWVDFFAGWVSELPSEESSQ